VATPEWTVSAADAGVRLDKFLAAADHLGSRGRAQSALERGKVFVNGTETGRNDGARRLRARDVVRVWIDRPGSAKARPRAGRRGELHIIYEDDELIVINKPPGLLAVPLERKAAAPSVVDLVEEYFRPRGRGGRRAFVVHRIDRDTSGLVVFAKNARAQGVLKAQFKRREPERVYLAVVYGHPNPVSGTWRDHLVWDKSSLIQKQTHPRDPRGSVAISEYRVAETFPGASLIEVRLHTGRRNQIRLQARLHGHTLVGEQRYVFGPDTLRPIEFDRQALHAWRLKLKHPVDGRRLEFEAPMPKDFSALLRNLRAGSRQQAGSGQRAAGSSEPRR
jgi:23S rRNA pseudouridine1911/1915/1917 synthase